MTGTLLSVIVSSIRSLKDGSVSVAFETNELSPSKAGELFSLRGKIAALYISPKETIPQKELDQVDSIDVTMPGKSHSQRMRNVLFRLWEQESDGFKDFNSYYAFRMENFIAELKNNLP
jgi:hypothetical protein